MIVKKKNLNLASIIIETLALIPVISVMLWWYADYFWVNFTYVFFLVTASLLYFPLFVGRLIISLRPFFSTKKVKITDLSIVDKLVMNTTFILSLFFLGLAMLFIYSLRNELPPQFFPLDDPNATYTVETNYDKYTIHYHTDQQTEKNSYKNCQFIAGKQVCIKEYTYDFVVMVGNSPFELENLRQKKVQIEGEFVYANQQCIVDKCIDMKMAALDIKSIKEITQ